MVAGMESEKSGWQPGRANWGSRVTESALLRRGDLSISDVIRELRRRDVFKRVGALRELYELSCSCAAVVSIFSPPRSGTTSCRTWPGGGGLLVNQISTA